MTEEQLRQEYAGYTDEALRKIIYFDAKDYESYALDAAKAELLSRYEPLFTNDDGGTVPFRALLDGVTWEEAADALAAYVCDGGDCARYAAVFDRLHSLSPGDDLPVTLDFFAPYAHSSELDIRGRVPTQAEEVDVTFLPWSDWLSARVSEAQILRYGLRRLVAVSLTKLTANGFDENDTPARLDELGRCFGEDAPPEDNEDETQAEQETDFAADESEDGPQHRPWVRFLARMLDYTYFGLIVNLVLKYGLHSSYRSAYSFTQNGWAAISLSAAAWVFIEAFLLATVGTTPGKWLLRVKLRDQEGLKLRPRTAFLRSALVWLLGYGAGLQFISAVAMFFSYSIFKSKGVTFWDEKLKVNVSHERIGTLRATIAIVLFLLPIAILVVAAIVNAMANDLPSFKHLTGK